MSQIRYAGSPSGRVHRGTSRTTQKRRRWMYVPQQKKQFTPVDVQLFLECCSLTVACVVLLFFVWLSAG